MRKYRLCALALVFTGIMALTVAGCKPSEEAVRARNERRQARMAEAAAMRQDLNLAATSADVRTIQLYRGEDERQLPILALGANDRITLEFDVMGSRGRPLSIYFYHANREWQRDLSPVEYLTSFQRDELLDFSLSRATDTPYVHYTYQFPNESIGFSLSGNYILRVTEQGFEDEVLFEQPFFITEQSTPQELAFTSAIIGSGYPATLPILRFIPPSDLGGNAFDYSVCFVRNGRYELARCSTNPMLAAQPALQFELEPEFAFMPEPAEYFLDLRYVRPGAHVEQADLSTSPPSVTLKPDYANFPGTPLADLLNGQTVVSAVVDNVADPDFSGEYVEAGFSLVPPDEMPFSGDVVVVGSFSDWQVDPRNELTWVPERGRYEGSVLLKQGLYEYRYASSDPRYQRALSMAPPRVENLYSTFVYYRDMLLNTDRLISAEGVTTR